MPSRSGRAWRIVAGALAMVLVAYYLVPFLGLVLARSPSTLVSAATSARALTAAVTSVGTAAVSTLLATVFGLPLAYWLARTDSPLRGPVALLVVLPLVVPPVVSGLVLLPVLGPTGIGSLPGVTVVRTLAGVIAAQTFVASPFLVVTATAAFERTDRRLEEAAWVMGAGPVRTVRRVTLPLAWTGVLAGVTLTFARAMGEFGATMILAYYPRTLPVQIWASFRGRGLDVAFALATVQIAVALTAIAVITALGESPWRR